LILIGEAVGHPIHLHHQNIRIEFGIDACGSQFHHYPLALIGAFRDQKYHTMQALLLRENQWEDDGDTNTRNLSHSVPVQSEDRNAAAWKSIL
jgi:hypothetical protein